MPNHSLTHTGEKTVISLDWSSTSTIYQSYNANHYIGYVYGMY